MLVSGGVRSGRSEGWGELRKDRREKGNRKGEERMKK